MIFYRCRQFSAEGICKHCDQEVIMYSNGHWQGKKVRLIDKIMKILEFLILSIEKLFEEKLGDFKNIGGQFRVLFEENCVSEKNYKYVCEKNINFYSKYC